MTDARFPERWLLDRRITRLPDNAFRLYITSLVWSVANRTDGVLDVDDLVEIHADKALCARLVESGLWSCFGETWFITDFTETQTSSDDLKKLAQMRKSARDRQRKHRDVSRDRSRDGSRDPTRTGQARTGSSLTVVEGDR